MVCSEKSKMYCDLCGENKDDTKLIITPRELLNTLFVCNACQPIVFELIREELKKRMKGQKK